MDPDDAPFSTRRIPHGRLHKGGKSGRGAVFDVRRTFGSYEVVVDAPANVEDEEDGEGDADDGGNGNGARSGGMKVSGTLAGTLEIHGLTDGGTGVVCSLNLGRRLTGMALLAGSRKTLAAVVDEAERGSREDDAEEEEEDDDDDDDDEDEEDDYDHDDDDDGGRSANGRGRSSKLHRRRRTSIEEDDERENRIARVFEKNSFRSPKFWMKWRCDVVVGVQSARAARDEENEENEDEDEEDEEKEKRAENRGKRAEEKRYRNGAGEWLQSNSKRKKKRVLKTRGEANSAYLVFAGNDCQTFKGTFSSALLGFKDAPFKGWKRTPKPSACGLVWTDVQLD